MIGSHVFQNARLSSRDDILLVRLLCDILLSHLFFESCSKVIEFDFANTLPVLIRNSNLTVEYSIRFFRFLTINNKTPKNLLLELVFVAQFIPGQLVKCLLYLWHSLFSSLFVHNFEGIAREVVQVGNLVAEITELQILFIKFTVLYVHLDDIEDIR